ncbi:hypothetical protein AMECASPLE_006387, partial [Ameca splendens]
CRAVIYGAVEDLKNQIYEKQFKAIHFRAQGDMCKSPPRRIHSMASVTLRWAAEVDSCCQTTGLYGATGTQTALHAHTLLT